MILILPFIKKAKKQAVYAEYLYVQKLLWAKDELRANLTTSARKHEKSGTAALRRLCIYWGLILRSLFQFAEK